MPERKPVIAILGASGLIGEALTRHLLAEGYIVRPLARRFTAAQRNAFGAELVEEPLLRLPLDRLAQLLTAADIVVKCIGVLQDSTKGTTLDVHETFVARLLTALGPSRLLLHVSIPEATTADATPFSITKRRAEALIGAGDVPYVILRPGFVVAEAAYGGSALIRALAVWPVALPPR